MAQESPVPLARGDLEAASGAVRLGAVPRSGMPSESGVPVLRSPVQRRVNRNSGQRPSSFFPGTLPSRRQCRYADTYH